MRAFHRLRLRSKLVVLAVAAALATGVATSFAAYVQVRDAEFAAAEARLEAAAKLHSDHLRGALALIRTDAQALAAMPPVPGILRASASGDGVDPLDRSTLDLWQARLEQIFASFLETRPHYTQLRFIGIADNWRELVRVNRGPDGPRAVPGAGLQQKGAEPYLQNIAALTRSEAMFSRVTYNREHGRPVGPPTLRLIHPVTGPEGLFGAIVVNTDFADLLRTAGFDPRPGFEVQVLTDRGDHMTFRPGATATLAFHDDEGWAPSPFAAAAAGAGQAALSRSHGKLFRATPIIGARDGAPFALTLVTATTVEALYASARAALLRSAAISALLIALAGGAAALIGAHLPLGRLAAALRAHSPGNGPFEVPSGVDDETLTIALTFADMSSQMLRQTLRIRSIYAGVPDAIVTIDEDGTIEDVNPAVEALFGYAPEDLIDGPLEVLMPDDIAPHHARFVRAVSNVRDSRPMTAARDIYGRRKDGSLVPLDISVSGVEYDGKPHFIGVMRDITARKQAEAELAELLAALERSNEELDKFAYVASHDLKAPLRVIDNAAGWLEEDLADVLTEDTRESLDMLRGRVRRMERLLDDLLAHSRIGRDGGEATVVSGAELADTLRGLLNLPEGMQLHVSDAFRRIEVQTMPVTTILLNLLSNAVKHHDRTDGNIWLDAAEVEQGLELSVADDGPGIAPEYHERIFEMFQTLRPRDEVDGSGLGLAMVRKYAAIAGGRINVTSDGGRGTRFTLLWPHDGRSRPAEIAA